MISEVEQLKNHISSMLDGAHDSLRVTPVRNKEQQSMRLTEIKTFNRVLELFDKKFILVPDNSNAWYVIPSDRLGDWISFLSSDEIEQGSIPSYADRVGKYPCKVTFQNYRIKHICCACCC